MTKPFNSPKNPSMVLPATKPRNPFGVGANMGKAGSHQKSSKAQRLQDNKATKDLASKPGYTSEDFSP